MDRKYGLLLTASSLMLTLNSLSADENKHQPNDEQRREKQEFRVEKMPPLQQRVDSQTAEKQKDSERQGHEVQKRPHPEFRQEVKSKARSERGDRQDVKTPPLQQRVDFQRADKQKNSDAKRPEGQKRPRSEFRQEVKSNVRSDRGDGQRVKFEKAREPERFQRVDRQEKSDVQNSEATRRAHSKPLEKIQTKTRSKDSDKRDKKIDRDSDRQRVRVGEGKSDRIQRDKLKVREERWSSRGKLARERFVRDRRNDHIFDDYFWTRFRRHHHDWSFDSRFSWSTSASWPSLVVWLPWKWSQPVYYYYDDNGSVFYGESQDSPYLMSVPQGSGFIAEAVRIANKQRPLFIDTSSWMPLGMYALSYDGEGLSDLSEYISLAISKEGFITGAYFNGATGETFEIRGSVDSSSQRAAWKFVGKDWPIMESGLYNLTNDEATMLVHSVDGRTESKVIIRLKQ